MSLFDLSGRVALVTGGSRGIGAAVSIALAEAGADVAVNYRSDSAAAEKTAAAVHATGRRCVVVRADVSVAGEVTRLVGETESALGPVDILVANAGVAKPQPIEETTEADFAEVVAVNLNSAFLCAQAVLPGMRARGWGRLIFMTSGAAHMGGSVGIHYSASKGGMEGLSHAYARRLLKEGVTSNCVAPTLIDTDMAPQALGGADPADRVPVGRLGTSEETAMAVVMLAANGYMTGQSIAVNGGVYFT